MTDVAPLEIRRFSELLNKARVVEECARNVALARDARGGNNDRCRGEFFQPKGQNFKRDGHAPQHPQGQDNFRGANYDQFRQTRGRGICFSCGLPGQIAKHCRKGKKQNAGRNQQPGWVFTLDARYEAGSDPLMKGKRILWV
ncbi:hypothetical protein AHAS_Ahas15G0209200 [Arachis hypogaea]